MLRTAFRIIRLDICNPVNPLYEVCEVTLDAEGNPVAWRSGDIQIRASSTEGLVDVFEAVKSALGGAILSERELHEKGVKFVQGR